jgi:hypothetical protein
MLRSTICNWLQLLVIANIPSSLILSTLVLKAINSIETSVLKRATRNNILEDGSIHNHPCDKLKSY